MPLPENRPPENRPPATRVGYVLTMFPRFSETFVLTELLALEARGLEVRVLSLRSPDDGRFHAALGDLRAPVTYLPHLTRSPKGTAVWQALRGAHGRLPGLAAHLDDVLALPAETGAAALAVATEAVEQGLTHLHAHFADTPATVARVAARLAGITCSLTAHAKDVFHDGLDADALRANLAGVDTVVTVSDFHVDHLRGLAPTANVVRVYNGLDLDRFARHTGRRATRTVAAVGRLVPKKGFDVLLEATALWPVRATRSACSWSAPARRRGACATSSPRSGSPTASTSSDRSRRTGCSRSSPTPPSSRLPVASPRTATATASRRSCWRPSPWARPA